MADFNIVNRVNSAFAEEFEVAEESLKPDTDLIEDLELDSLDAADLIASMEREFKIKLPEEQARQLRTMGDIYEFVDRLVAQAS